MTGTVLTNTIMILGMAAVTVFVKAALFVLGDRVVFPPLLKQALGFVPVTVLTAIIVPMILSPNGEGLELTWRNPQLVGALAAVLVCVVTGKQLLTIAVALGVFFAWQLGVLA
ncbi:MULTISPECIES: AzlD domain-containing protein [Azospirillum]|uniref:AzlD domain-containing protein n=1 Tax=Azospirillum brasilense TaxID=192 RepID=A0ABU4P299_AZOBR|nr:MULTISPECIES: AzlD domain-containing protein [Azospirillum]ALJ37883.1 branched-chain amino acid transporter [Azospirillum brasilense]MDW7556581.1 AzlD domain-containing protein [Azospirillum brasilense]MDW7596349.1 AzlD domain-containing protein [Azospirillum brasilense]MDW7631239.1 AzlD domain-containing protein [Azospirillum brasilense]MDX5951907.1 AzlD domain-containing protein [Azospirillum brasilense]